MMSTDLIRTFVELHHQASGAVTPEYMYISNTENITSTKNADPISGINLGICLVKSLLIRLRILIRYEGLRKLEPAPV
jgi:hypothetical protein